MKLFYQIKNPFSYQSYSLNWEREKSVDRIKISEFFAIAISLAAFALSCYTLYIQFFHVNHSLKASAFISSFESFAGKEDPFIVKGVITNAGNCTEVLYSAQLELYIIGHYYPLSKIGPIVLKPGESMTLNFKDYISCGMDFVGKWDSASDSLFLNARIIFESVSPNGIRNLAIYELENLYYDKPNDVLYPSIDRSQDKAGWKEICAPGPDVWERKPGY